MLSEKTGKTTPTIVDKSVLDIRVVDNQDPIIDIRHLNEMPYGSSPEIPNNTNYTKMRKTVYEKLKQAQTLLPKHLRLCLFEAYRSLELQQALYEARFEKIKKMYPDWSWDELFTETIKMVSPVVNRDGSKNVPPHSTGGAVDLYLIDEQGKPVDMGIHPQNWMQDPEGLLSLTESTLISAEATKNRKIMCDVLTAVGFVNYFTEYWHWSYGDRYWACLTGQSQTLYGSIE